MVTILLIVLVLAVLEIASLYFWPYAPCRKCKGSGKNAGSSRKRYGDCSRCGATGRRRRIGAQRVHDSALEISKRFKGGMRR